MKTNFDIFIDSTGDLDSELRKKYDIDYLRFGVAVEDGDRMDASLDYDQGMSHHDFYETLRQGKRIYTQQVSEQEVTSRFIPSLKNGHDILYIACSSGLSASLNVARKVSKDLMEQYPGRKIICIDSLISGYAQGEMGIKASEMRENGKTLEETAKFIGDNVLCFNQFATVENLTTLKKAGRVTASSAFFGNLFQVKPILISDVKGHNYAIEKVKGRKASLIHIADLAVDCCLDPENEVFYVADSDDAEAAQITADAILRKIPNAKIHRGPLGPIIGACTGPGTVSVYVYGKPVTACGE